MDLFPLGPTASVPGPEHQDCLLLIAPRGSLDRVTAVAWPATRLAHTPGDSTIIPTARTSTPYNSLGHRGDRKSYKVHGVLPYTIYSNLYSCREDLTNLQYPSLELSLIHI